MARTSVRFKVVEQSTDVYLHEADKKVQEKMFHDFALQELNKARAHNKNVLGYAPDYDTFVDGARKPYTAATLSSTILFEFELLNTMLEWIADMLILFSPVGEGTDPRPGHPELYARSHVLFADGIEVDPDGPVQQAKEYVFVNVQPYARKIERGLSAQAPAGVYEVVATRARQKYSNVGSIKFGFRTPMQFGAIHAWANTTSMQSPYRRGEKRDEWLRRQPAIIVNP